MANSYLPATYQSGWSYGNQQQQPSWQSYGQQSQYPGFPQQQSNYGMKWVDGETEAKGTPIPAGTTQFAMWDINEPVIYIKSLNQMGMPNPMQKARYKIESNDKSGMSRQEEKPEDSAYVTKEAFDQMKEELKELINQSQQSRRSGRNETNV